MRDNISRRLKRDIAPLLLLLVGIAGCRDQKPVEEQADISVTVSIPDSGPIDGSMLLHPWS